MIVSKNELINNIATEISDNSTGQISPYDVRHNLLDIIDSVHLLLDGKEISASNIGTLDVRTTRVGVDTLTNIVADNHISEDNSAFGHSALKANFQGVKNTAIGSSALSCNVYGENNVAIGYNALASNSVGVTNVGLGNFAIQNNKWGSGNVAIGHAAGYYAPRHTNNKLFIASHPVDSQYICDNPLGSGLTPLVYGDFLNYQFGIGVNSLHNDATLQVSGAIGPSATSLYDLGSSNYRFNKLYLSSGVSFPSGNLDYSYSLSGIASSLDIVPLVHNEYNLGTDDNRWAYGYFDQLYANEYNIVETCKFACKTLYLASSGLCESDNPCGYLSDNELENAGFLIQSSGSETQLINSYDQFVFLGGLSFITGGIGLVSEYRYKRNYSFDFQPSDSTLTYLEADNVYSRSSWNSNISIHVASGCHVKTDRVIGSGNLSLVTQHPSGYGLFLRDGLTFLSSENLLSPNPSGVNGHLAGVGNVNLFSTSGSYDDYVVTYGGIEPGTDIVQRFLSNVKKKTIVGNQQKLEGFQLRYFDDSDLSYVFSNEDITDRFVISSYHDTVNPINSIVLLKDSGGTLCVNNFDTGGDSLLPNTILNVRSQEDAVVRIAAENEGYYKSAIQLVAPENCLNSGVEFVYYNNSGISDINMYKDSGQEVFIRMVKDPNLGGGKIGLFAASGSIDEMLVIGGSGYDNAVISINESVGAIYPTYEYGKLFVRERIVNDTQSSSLYFLDSSGNLFDLVRNKYDGNDTLFTDENRNTFAGLNCNTDRRYMEKFGAYDNTAYGYSAISELASGDKNTVFGSYAAQSLVSGVSNVAIGYMAMRFCNGGASNNIVIGNESLGYNLSTNNTLLLGNGSYPLLSGNLSSSNRQLFVPNGKVYIQNSSATESLFLKNNTIEVVDSTGDDYPQNQLDFKFSGNNTATLLTLKHSGVPLNKVATYEFANSGIPYAELNGDLRLKNAIRFSDETSLYSAKEIHFASGLSITNSNILSSLIVEGIAQEEVLAGSFTTPTSGIIRTGSNEDIFVSNKDQYLQIHPRDYVIAIKIGNEYRPLWVSSEVTACQCCGH